MKQIYCTLALIFSVITVTYSNETVYELEKGLNEKVELLFCCGEDDSYNRNRQANFKNSESLLINDIKKPIKNKVEGITNKVILNQLYPNPTSIGEHVSVEGIRKGEVISIFDPTGTLILNQMIDIDKLIYTNELSRGEYIIRTENRYLKLIVQ